MNHNMTGYAVICDARMGQDLGISVLALVDRNITRSGWWTSDDPSLIVRFTYKHAAERAMRRFNHNNPRVVQYAEAYGKISYQQTATLAAELYRIGINDNTHDLDEHS